MTLTRELIINGRYLNLPIKDNGPRRTMRLFVDGVEVRAFEIELAAADDVDHWMFTEVDEWRGHTLVVTLEPQPVVLDEKFHTQSAAARLAADALDVIAIDDAIRDGDSHYRETLRPQFHFTSRRGHLNDPNGLFWHDGEYHLFYQHDPYSIHSSCNKAWGHAVSPDLIHWHELPVALHADEEGNKWSGSGLVDWHNVTGLARDGQPPLLLYYTATGFSAQHLEPGSFVQSIAVSYDRGRTWTPYAGNPIIPTLTPGNRDPLVFWHEPTQRWLMTLFVGQPESWYNRGNRCEAQILSSTDLIHWQFESIVPGFHDCPILAELPIEGTEGDTRWIMHCANLRYQLGTFDGHVFTPETDLITGQWGDCAYAAQFYNHAPNGRKIQIAWARTTSPGMPFDQAMCVPCEVSLVNTSAGLRARWTPVPELERLRGPAQIVPPQTLADGETIDCLRGQHLDLNFDIAAGTAQQVVLQIRGVEFVVDVIARTLAVEDKQIALHLTDGRLQLRLLVDRILIEVFADEGLSYAPLALIPAIDDDCVTVQARGGDAELKSFTGYELTSIWPQP
ncbi:MAG: glycoside hydrolase family 32 protein [Cephaloticoccus sp.]|nr:glycoside hydrolase family 32 protein [Cephaloticoccus sp.]